MRLVCYFYVLITYLVLIGSANWTATLSHVIYLIHLQSNSTCVSRWITRSVKAAGIGMFTMNLLKVGIVILSRKFSFK